MQVFKAIIRVLAAALLALVAAAAPAAESFDAFVGKLWPDAQARGVTRQTFDLAFNGVTPDPQVAALTDRQAEFIRPIGKYLDGAVTPKRIEQGQKLAALHKDTLAAIEKRYGVDPATVLAVWGVETDFGGFTGAKDVIRSLATLTHMGYRAEYFREELLVALLILQDGHVPRDKFRGSWAGAMGHGQFMPSSFRRFAVDFSGDGHNDIWTNIPDALASIANYLAGNGWRRGLPWGFQVEVPAGYDLRRSRGTFDDWRARGVVRADGGKMPEKGDAILFHPSGHAGPAFLATANFVAIKTYNISDAYALAVGQLGDRIKGAPKPRTAWPERLPLDRKARILLQNRLAAAGYAVNDFNGRIDFDLRDVIREVQAKNDMVPDGEATQAVLDSLAR